MSQRTKLVVLIVLVTALIVVTMMTFLKPPRKVVRVREATAMVTRDAVAPEDGAFRKVSEMRCI